MEALPAPRSQAYKDAQVGLSYNYGAIQLSGQSFELAKSDSQAFASVLDQEVNGMKEGLRKDMNRQVYGTSQGVLAVAASGSTTTLVNTAAGALKYLEVGMIVDIYDSTSTVSVPVLNNAGVEITNIVLSTGTVTFGSTVTAVASGDFIVRSGSHQKEPVGFEQITAGLASTATALGDGTGALFNITDAVWRATIDTSGGAISEGRMTKMIDDIASLGGKTTAMFTTLGVRRAYANLLQQQRRYVNTTKFTGGFSALAFTTSSGDIPMVDDFDCQTGRIYYMNESELKLYQAGDWSWMNRDGNMWQRLIDSSGEYDAYRARLYRYWQLGTHRRNSHGLQTGITEA